MIIGLVARSLGSSDTDDSKTEVKVDTNSAAAAVETYFDAVKAGDVEAIKKLSDKADPALDELTPEAVKAAAEAGPVTDLKVEGKTSSSYVDAKYSIKGESVDSLLSLSKTGDGWKMDEVVVEVSTPQKLPDGVSYTANGAPMTELKLTPGVWEIATTNPFLSVSPTSIVIDDLSFPNRPNLEVELTAEGEKAARDALQTAVDECLGDAIACGITKGQIRDGGTIDQSTLKCTLDQNNDTPEKAEIRLDYDGDINGFSYFKVECEGKSTTGDPVGGVTSITDYAIDISDPNNVTATVSNS